MKVLIVAKTQGEFEDAIRALRLDIRAAIHAETLPAALARTGPIYVANMGRFLPRDKDQIAA